MPLKAVQVEAWRIQAEDGVMADQSPDYYATELFFPTKADAEATIQAWESGNRDVLLFIGKPNTEWKVVE